MYAFMNLPPPLSMTACAMVDAITSSIVFQEPASWAGVVRGAAQINIRFIFDGRSPGGVTIGFEAIIVPIGYVGQIAELSIPN